MLDSREPRYFGGVLIREVLIKNRGGADTKTGGGADTKTGGGADTKTKVQSGPILPNDCTLL